jgi:NAD(P)H-dependent FMN reductase
MSSLLLLNGSPRGPRSNSMRMLEHLAEGWQAAESAGAEAAGPMPSATPTSAPRVLHLAHSADFAEAVAAFATAETVVLGMPLYTDSMPGLVAEFIEALEPRVGRSGNPRIGFLVQSGFAEPLHSRGLERYLAKLTRRLDAPYAGTIVRGSGESLQAMPDQALGKLFAQLAELGGQLATDGRFDPETLSRVAGHERFSAGTAVLMSVAFKVPVSRFYWNGQLKKNLAWDKRFNAPYARAAR